jgi:hypothetical protein
MLLLQDRRWEPPPHEEEPRRPSRGWHLPWRPLAWFALWCWLMALVPVVGSAFGNLAGYGVLLVAIALVLWRLDRLCQRLNWTGMREYKS